MSPTTIAILRPLCGVEAGTIRNFAWVHPNPAGQQMLRQPAGLTTQLLTLFPTAKAEGVFDQCGQAFSGRGA